MVDTWKELARKDEVAALGTATPAAVTGAAADDGTATAASKEDHVHALGPLAAALDCNQQQMTDMVLHQSSSAPSPAVKGQIYMDSDDGKVYVCTAV